LAAYEAAKDELKALDVAVYAVSVDNEEQAREVQGKGLSFPMAYGATRADADNIGAWWSDDRGGYVQPAEFLLGRGGVVLGAMYASGPVGRMGSDEVVRFIQFRENRRRQEEGE
jgi:peroxiredoxin